MENLLLEIPLLCLAGLWLLFGVAFFATHDNRKLNQEIQRASSDPANSAAV
jgi:hypothetical protein